MTYFLPNLGQARAQVASEHETFAAASCPGGVRDLYKRLASEVREGLHDQGLMQFRVSA